MLHHYSKSFCFSNHSMVLMNMIFFFTYYNENIPYKNQYSVTILFDRIWSTFLMRLSRGVISLTRESIPINSAIVTDKTLAFLNLLARRFGI